MDFSIAITSWVCSLLFGVCALWIYKRRKPINFFHGTVIEPKEITDIPAYNRANALMWTIYAACFVLTGILSLFDYTAGLVMMLFLFLPGLIPLYIFHKRIYNKYKHTDSV